MPAPRGLAGAASVGSKVYLVGGTDNYYNVHATVQIYNPLADSWSFGAPMPTPRSRMAVVAATNGKIYTFGGQPSFTDIINTVEAYDPVSNGWATRSSTPVRASGFAGAAAPNGKIYLFGGYTGCCWNNHLSST